MTTRPRASGCAHTRSTSRTRTISGARAKKWSASASRYRKLAPQIGKGGFRMPLRAHGLIALVVLLVVAMAAILRASDSPLPLTSYNWAVNASPNLAAKPPPEADIRKLIEQEDSDQGEDNDGTEICSFKFVDLGHDGNLTLLVTRHDGGRGGCGDVHVVDRTAAGFEEHNVWGGPYGVDDVNNNVLVDIDGKPYLSEYDYFANITQGGSQCFAGYTRIYSWDGSNYSNQSAQPRFKPFYEQRRATKTPNASRRASPRFSELFLARRRIPVLTTQSGWPGATIRCGANSRSACFPISARRKRRTISTR